MSQLWQAQQNILSVAQVRTVERKSVDVLDGFTHRKAYGPPMREIRLWRDKQMARLLRRGKSQREIAKALGISRTAVQKRMRQS